MSPTRPRRPAGQVALVGAGTGDPGLLVLRAAELLGVADLVLADERISPAVLALASGEVLIVPAGELQSAALVAAAKDGKHVVRLYVGDPFLGEDGAKEAEAVVKAKQRLEVVPGLPGPVAVPAFAGVPVGLPRTVAKVEDVMDWSGIASAPGTLVLTARVGQVAKAASALIEHGLKAGSLVSVTVGGTTAEQRTVLSSLDEVEHELHDFDLGAEVIVVVGDAVKRADKLGWYENRALYGWRVLVPRTRDQAGGLSAALRSYGAIPVEVPTIAVEPPRTPAPMERAIKGLVTGRYLWVAFTSTNAVKAVREKLEEFGLDARAFAGVKVAAVGETTAAALVEFGIRPELVPSGHTTPPAVIRLNIRAVDSSPRSRAARTGGTITMLAKPICGPSICSPR